MLRKVASGFVMCASAMLVCIVYVSRRQYNKHTTISGVHSNRLTYTAARHSINTHMNYTEQHEQEAATYVQSIDEMDQSESLELLDREVDRFEDYIDEDVDEVAYDGLSDMDVVGDPGADLQHEQYPEKQNPKGAPQRPGWRHYIPPTKTNLHQNITCDVIIRRRPAAVSDRDTWQDLEANISFVYSAFLDPRNKTNGIIRVFGLMRFTSFANREYFCQVWSIDRNKMVAIGAEVSRIGTRQTRFVAVQFQCDTTQDPWIIPESSISITTMPCEQPKNQMYLHRQFHDAFQADFSVCLGGALKNHYSKVYQFVEWIELNTILGSEHFTVYKFSSGEQLSPYLNVYEKKGALSVLPWDLPIDLSFVKRDKETFATTWNYAQDVLIQDCLYRNMWRSRYVVFVDLDEIIVPRSTGVYSWSEMLRRDNCPPDTALYLVRNMFFPLNETDSAQQFMTPENETVPYMITMRKTTRDTYIDFARVRSKYIAVPHNVYLLTVHQMLSAWGEQDSRTCVLRPTSSLLHHYRFMKARKIIEKTFKEDRTIHKLRNSLEKNIQTVHKLVQVKEY